MIEIELFDNHRPHGRYWIVRRDGAVINAFRRRRNAERFARRLELDAGR